MKSLLQSLYDFFYETGKIRAAMTLSRLGRYNEAKYLIDKE